MTPELELTRDRVFIMGAAPEETNKICTQAAIRGSRVDCVRFGPDVKMDEELSRSGNNLNKSASSSEALGGRESRLQQPRMSLLGRPLNYRGNRRDARYRRLQTRVYNFLERPRGGPAISYHILVFFMVFTCLTLSVFATIEEYQKKAEDWGFYMEIVALIWFSIEFFIRLWSSGCRSRYQDKMGLVKFLRQPFCVIDVITILASLAVLSFGVSGSATALRSLRFFQILRLVRMDRRGGTWKLLGSVVYAHRQELITTLYIGFLGLIFTSFLVFIAEKDTVNTKFKSFADALWWGVITLCTVGYGDIFPITWTGKIISSFCALLGISFFALPAGILGSGFALKVQQQQRQKHMIRRRQPAATLIQCLWRCYAADEHSLSVATWKIHQVPVSSPTSKTGDSVKSVTRASSSFKHNASFVSRFPTIRRNKSTSFHSPRKPALSRSPSNAARYSTDNLGASDMKNMIKGSQSEDSVTETNISKKCSDDEDEEPRYIQLTSQHKAAIRAIRKIKFYVAKRKFREALKPYDVKDVLEQYAVGHSELIGRLKYFAARKKFREALKPYDVKDVMEQYSSGHADLLTRVRHLQYRLDQILGKQGSKAKDVYASKISLASRIVKVERQVDDIEAKIDQLMELYMEDRKRFLTLPLIDSQNEQKVEKPLVSVLPAPSFPRPQVLLEKTLSEPCSPTEKLLKENASRMKKRVTLSSIPSHSQESTTTSENELVIFVPVPQPVFPDTVVAIDSDSDENTNEHSASEYLCEPTSWSSQETTLLINPNNVRIQVSENSSKKALLLTRAAGTDIIVTPISRSNSMSDLERDPTPAPDLNLLCPDTET